MPQPKSRRRASAVVLLVPILTLICTLGAGSQSANAAGPKTLTVTPATSLGNEVALVQWTGFKATSGFNHTVTIQQCKGDPQQIDADGDYRTIDDCLTALPFPNSDNGNEIVNGITQRDGTGSAYVEILTAAQNSDLGCNVADPCTLIAYDNNEFPIPKDALPKTSVTAAITFAPGVTDCPPVSEFDVRAEGEASAAPLFYSWAAKLCTASPTTVLDYTETNSVSGRQDFLANQVEMGVTSMPTTSAERAAAAGYPSYTYAPIDLTAVAIAYNMNDSETGQRITDLVLTPRLVARVISDSDLNGFFSDPELLALNPDHHWPVSTLSQPLIRAERNADTYITTDWIAHDSGAEQFLHGTDAHGIVVNPAWKDVNYPIDIFENRESGGGYLPIQGETTVVRKVFSAAKPDQSTTNDPGQVGFIGVVDLAAAQRYRLPVAKLVNHSGNAVAPDAAGLTAGYNAMTTNPDGITKSSNFASTDAAAYPLVKVDYGMVPTTLPTAASVDSMKRFLGYVGSEGQQTMPVGYLPMPADLAAQDAAAAGKIHVATTPPSKTPRTTPTTIDTTSPFTDLGSPSGFADGGGTNPPTPDGTVAPAPGVPRVVRRVPVTPLPAITPVVGIEDPAERFGLPVVAALALLAGLYPLSRRGAPLIGRGLVALRSRIRRIKPPPPAAAAS